MKQITPDGPIGVGPEREPNSETSNEELTVLKLHSKFPTAPPPYRPPNSLCPPVQAPVIYVASGVLEVDEIPVSTQKLNEILTDVMTVAQNAQQMLSDTQNMLQTSRTGCGVTETSETRPVDPSTSTLGQSRENEYTRNEECRLREDTNNKQKLKHKQKKSD